MVMSAHFCVKLKMCTNQFHIFGQMDKNKLKYSKMGQLMQMMPTTSLDWIAVIKYDFLAKQ